MPSAPGKNEIYGTFNDLEIWPCLLASVPCIIALQQLCPAYSDDSQYLKRSSFFFFCVSLNESGKEKIKRRDKWKSQRGDI